MNSLILNNVSNKWIKSTQTNKVKMESGFYFSFYFSPERQSIIDPTLFHLTFWENVILGLLMATVRLGCFSLINNYQRSVGGNLNFGTCKGCKIWIQFLPNVFPRKRICYKYKHSGEYWLDKTHRNFTNSLKLVIVQFSTNEIIVSKMRLLTPT